MMRGKYSPTVRAAYAEDQEWFSKYAKPENPDDFAQYDPEGFDSYGYSANDVDRAGNHESDYSFCGDHESDDKYHSADNEWAFDGTKPVLSEYGKAKVFFKVLEAKKFLEKHGFTVMPK